jgi:hypothetical protein
VFYHLHHFATSVLLEDLWQRNKSEGENSGLVLDRKLFDNGYHRNCLGVFTEEHGWGQLRLIQHGNWNDTTSYDIVAFV